VGLPCLSELPHSTSSRALVRGSLPAVPPAARCSTQNTVRGHGPGCSHRLGRPSRVWPDDLCHRAWRRDGFLPGVPLPYSGRDLPESTFPKGPTLGLFRPRRFTRPRRFAPPAGFRPFSGRCRSWGFPFRALLLPGSRTPFGANTLLPFLDTAFLHSEVSGRTRSSAAAGSSSVR